MQLRSLIQKVTTVKVEGNLDREVSGITYDSRRVTPGMIFVAIPGQNVDGHKFIEVAIDRGASAIICERNGFVSNRVTKVKVADARQALAEVAMAYYANPSMGLKMIGITGTNGKTTVAFLVKQILEKGGIRCGLIGTVRYEIGERVIPATRTTPEALEIHQMLAQMNRSGCGACVMEVSSHALEQKRVAEICFDVAIFTNLTQDHLDYHGNFEAYYEAKKKLFADPPSGRKKSLVINIDDSYGRRLSSEVSPAIQLRYGLDSAQMEKEGGDATGMSSNLEGAMGTSSRNREDPAGQLRAVNVRLGPKRSQFRVESEGGSFDLDIPMIGRHNVYNALAATGAALAMGIDRTTIQSALLELAPVPGRLEPVGLNQPFGVYVDYAHTDDALRNVLETVREITSGRVLLAFGCGGSRDSGKRSKMGSVAASGADYTVITSDNPRKENPAVIASQIEAGYREIKNADYCVELDRRRAIAEIIGMARQGDTVIIAGKGHETYQEFEDTVVPFDDRVYAAEALALRGFSVDED